MSIIDDIQKEIKESEKRQKKFADEYSKKIAQITKALKQDYSTKILKEINTQKQLHLEIYGLWDMIKTVDHFDIDVLGKVLAKLLSQTTNQIYSYGRLKHYENCGICSSAIIFPKEKIKVDEDMNSRMSLGEIARDKSMVILQELVGLNEKIEISFYDYSSMCEDYCNIRPTWPLIVYFPQIEEFLNYVLVTHTFNESEHTHFYDPISEEELYQKLDEYLVNYNSKKDSNDCPRTLKK